MNHEQNEDPHLRGHLVALAGTDQKKINAAMTVIEAEVVGRIVRTHCARHPRQLEYPDAIQEVWVKLLSAAKTYDPAQPAAPYIATVTRRRLITLTQLQGAACRRVNSVALRFADTAQRGDAHCASDVTVADIITDYRNGDPLDAIQTQELAEIVRLQLGKLLSPYERDCMLMQMQGMTLAEIAKKEGTTVKSVDNGLQRARKKIEVALQADPDVTDTYFRRQTIPVCRWLGRQERDTTHAKEKTKDNRKQ